MRLLLAVFSAALLLSAPARADEATKNAKIEELMKVPNVDLMMGQIMSQMKGQMKAMESSMDVPLDARKNADEFEDRVMALTEKRLATMKPMLVKVYADTYTEEEIDGILAFYKTPVGQAMLRKMPELIQRSMAVSQQVMGEIMPEIQKMVQEQAEKTKHNPPSK